MKAITLWQPWASLWACGMKQYETRSWATSYRGPIAIHAAKKPFDTDTYFDRELHPFANALNLKNIYSFDELPYGCIIATAELVDCHKMVRDEYNVFRIEDKVISYKELIFGEWAPGRYAWEIANVKMLDNPIPASGKQGLWNWDDMGISAKAQKDIDEMFAEEGEENGK